MSFDLTCFFTVLIVQYIFGGYPTAYDSHIQKTWNFPIIPRVASASHYHDPSAHNSVSIDSVFVLYISIHISDTGVDVHTLNCYREPRCLVSYCFCVFFLCFIYHVFARCHGCVLLYKSEWESEGAVRESFVLHACTLYLFCAFVSICLSVCVC